VGAYFCTNCGATAGAMALVGGFSFISIESAVGVAAAEPDGEEPAGGEFGFFGRL